MLHSLKKYTKKIINKWTIAMSICLVSILSLFAMTKTYAYVIDNNGNLVGNNLLNENNTISTKHEDLHDNNTFSFENGNPTYTFNFENETNNGFITYSLRNNDFNSSTFVNCSVGVLVEAENMNDDNINLSVRIGNISNSGSINNTQDLLPNMSTGYLSNNASRLYFLYASLYPSTNTKYGYLIQLNLYNNTSLNLNGKIKMTFFMFNNIKPIGINSTQTFYPYSSIEELQQDYDALLIQYNNMSLAFTNYQNTHSYTNDQYNLLVSRIALLEQSLADTILQYNVYVATHSHSNDDYQTLLNQIQTLQNNYNSLQQQYNDLQDRFNEVIGESASAMYFALNGATANLYTDVNNVKTLLASDTISINENYMNFDNSCIPNINTYLNGYDSEDTTTYPNPYCYIEIDLNMSVNSVLLFTFDNTILDVDITLSSTISNVTNIYKRNSSLNAYQLVVNNDRLSFNKISYDGIYMPDYISIDFSLQIDGYSYSVGYDKGVASQQSRINSLNSSISSMQISINTLRASNEQLQDAINNSFGWKNLFFAMADTPFKTVSNVLGFELFGLNLFTTFIGMITVFAIIWLLKKFI